MSEPLQPGYLIQCEMDARRFQGAWTGTSGNLAAHVMRLLKDRKRIAEENERLREELAIERAKRHEQRAAIDGGY